MPLSNWAHPPRSQLASTPLVAHATPVAVSHRAKALFTYESPRGPALLTNFFLRRLTDTPFPCLTAPSSSISLLCYEAPAWSWNWNNGYGKTIFIHLYCLTCVVNGVDDVLLSVFTYLTVEVCSVSKISSISRINCYIPDYMVPTCHYIEYSYS